MSLGNTYKIFSGKVPWVLRITLTAVRTQLNTSHRRERAVALDPDNWVNSSQGCPVTKMVATFA